MLRPEKEKVVAQLRTDVTRAQGVLFVDFTGLSVNDANAFRQKLREGEGDIGYRVVKNSLLSRALQGSGAEGATEYLKGTPTGVVMGFDDPVSPAKITFEFLKDRQKDKPNQKMKVKGGILDEKPLDAKGAEALSKMPGRNELLAEIVGLALGPARTLLAQIKSPSGRIVGAIEKKAEEEG